MEKITIKQGATLSLAGLYALPAGNWSAACNVETPEGAIVTALACTLTALASPDGDGNTHGLLMVATSAQTALWEVGAPLVSDIKFYNDEVPPQVLKTDTFGYKVQQAVT